MAHPDVALFADVRVGLHEDLILPGDWDGGNGIGQGCARSIPSVYQFSTPPPSPWSPGIIELAGIFGFGL